MEDQPVQISENTVGSSPQAEDVREESTLKDNEKVTEDTEEEQSFDFTETFTDGAEELKKELDNIIVVAPEPEQPEEVFDPSEFPPSYKDNLPKEQLILQYADNFRRQYVHLYRDRKPLFLCPVNECGVEKFVCTTIRPTQLPFKELYNWDGAAEFVADYLDFEPLRPSYDLPTRLLSPATVLKRQKGNCFEYSTVLVSLLIAAGYDAYVVSGYAAKETCLADETREICPLLKKREEVIQEEKKKEMKKYSVKPPRDLRSKFILRMEARKVAKKKAEEEQQKAEEEKRILELEKPPPDPLYGLRIHAWVLVLSGKREVAESFFIEPFTGLSQPFSNPNYLGIESVWNNFNYWVNMQDCSEGVGIISYDLGDCTKWEYMLTGLDKPVLQVPEGDLDILDEDEEDKDKDVEKHLDMPPSWVEPLKLSQRDYEMRCPQGKKVKLYKRAKLEKFAHYLMKDGLVSRLSVYEDRAMTDLILVKEFFQHRNDKLHTRVHNYRNGWINEYFHPGRSHSLKEHQYLSGAPEPENERTMIFCDEARVDGLVKRIETPTGMTEHYKDREDFLYYKNVVFRKRSKRITMSNTSVVADFRPIDKMVVKYHRNTAKKANEDVRELVFLVSEEKIQMIYHTDDASIASSTREFVKPHNWQEKGAIFLWSPDMHQTFQVDPNTADSKQVMLYQLLLELLRMEDVCRQRVRESEEEVRAIIQERQEEDEKSELGLSIYDTERNDKTKQHRRELERQVMLEKIRKQEMEVDYLAPFLAQMSDPEKISRSQAYTLKEESLTDLKQRLVDKANLIQARFEKETEKLQKKQAWYHQNQISMSKEDEDDYLNYCSEAMFRIHILELRLNRHKEMAPHMYMALEQKLRNDPRLSEFL
ncbi:dynein regulatory complex subunit 7-like [Pomacea canaliculata]|uniref:dynein regulatory complex subunit 7-like n=1 Tax=Pomacea canaliculata TaxID=400727 RepID=UPI000D738CB8|nr:dynein regulatory complex subunit 7-like [Pomacea canaliculata]